MLISFALLVMFVLTVFTVIIGSDWSSTTVETPNNFNVSESEWMNDSFASGTFTIDTVLGAILIITVIAVIVAVIGFKIVGSGLSEQSVRIIMICVIYGGLWSVLSVLSGALILEIELFGSIIYVSLTVVYVIGVAQKISGGNET